ncbi:MAG: cobalamin B12-binding domain-containing protein [Eubacteriales bacterium]
MMSKLVRAFKELDEDAVISIVDEEIAAGTDPVTIVEVCNEGLTEVGNLFSEGAYFLTELMYSVDIMESVMAKVKPLLVRDGVDSKGKGKVIIGTVQGDIHDVGKNIVCSLLASHGYEVIDVGIDVPAEKFVEVVKTNSDAKVLGLSALLNTTYPQMKTVIETLAEEGLRDQVKIIIGGTICSETVREFTGADAFATQAMKGIKFCDAVYGKQMIAE